MAGSDVRGSETLIPSIEDHPRIRQYLSLQRLALSELPPHPEFSALHNENRPSLPRFLNIILAEVDKIDFDKGWISHGKWHPDSTHVHMPVGTTEGTTQTGAKAASADNDKGTTKPVPISVHQRVRVIDKATWLARTSCHLESDVTYTELDELLSQDHSRNEARYTPSVYDANELLTWSPQDLEKALGALHRDYGTQSVQMSSKLSLARVHLNTLSSVHSFVQLRRVLQAYHVQTYG